MAAGRFSSVRAGAPRRNLYFQRLGVFFDLPRWCNVAVFFLFVAAMNFAMGYALALYLAQDGDAAPRRVRAELATPFKLPPREAAWNTFEASPPAPPAPAPLAKSEPAPAAVPVAEAAAAVVDPQPAEVGASITDFKQELSHYRDQLASLDKRMRSSAESQDASSIKACLSELQLANVQYLGQQQEVSERFHLHGETAELEPISCQLTRALVEQADKVRHSNDQLEEVDLETNLLVGCQQLLDETARLVDANHAMRDALDDAELQLGRRGELRVDPNDAPADPLHNLISRVQLEATLDQWWQNDPQRERSLSVGLVDLDLIRDLNERRGLDAGDRILGAVAQVVGEVVQGGQRAARMSGQRFLLMFPDVLARDATPVLERIRQQVEATNFEAGEAGIAVTVSCSVAEAAPEDTRPTLLGRAEATLREAKRYGRNRTFLHDGKFPAPVVPPDLAIESRTLAI
jgi:diguanylate cyclase